MYRLLSICCLLFLFNTASLYAQKNINAYKYIIVPNLYEFQKSEDQYQLNSLVKFLFKKDGFNVLSSSVSFPEDLAKNPCMALKAILKNESGMLSTKVKIDLVDCYNTVVFSTEEGKSKIKDYKKGYHDAVRKAFVNIDSLHYKYNGTIKTAVVPAVVSSVNATSIAVKQNTPSTSVKEEVVAQGSVEKQKKVMYSIEGNYLIDIWGNCTITKKDNGYAIIGGDENYEFATISKTSKPLIFMVKKTGFSLSQLLELNEKGDLQMDTANGVKVFKRID